MHFKILKNELMNYKLENRIPWLFTDFANIKNFPWLFPDRGNPGFSVAFYKMKFGSFVSIDLGHVWVWGLKDMYMGKPRYQLANSTHFSTDIHGTNLLEIDT